MDGNSHRLYGRIHEESSQIKATSYPATFFLNLRKKIFCLIISFIKKLYNFVSGKYEMKFVRMEKEKVFTDTQEKIARYAKALSNPTRVFILDYLSNDLNKCCYSGDMAEILPIARSTLSEHLKELKKAGLIQGEINPPYIRYCINQDNWKEAKLLLTKFFNI
jgi:ArsR family transcriptional regulator